MKCVKLGDGKVIRVKDERAAYLVGKGDGTYTSRSEWKEKTRGPVDSAKCEGRE